MQLSSKVRMNRLFNNGKCLDVAIDHGIANEPDFLIGLEDIERVMNSLIVARPDAIQVNYGQADLLQCSTQRDKPALVMRTDVGNAYNAARHREMWAVLHNPEAPILAALQMDAAAVVVNLYLIPDEPGIFRQCVENIGRLRHACDRYGMPLMVEPLVMAPAGQGSAYGSLGDVEKMVPLVRLARELGADIIKADPTERVEDFHRIVEAARCPTLVRGGGKGELGAVLEKSAALMAQGASGMVYGRNVYQHDNPSKVVRALMAIIHQGASGQQGLEIYHQP
ncbi:MULTISPECIES: class I fructose-bisphosphate aldolase [Serratia]|jgi:class I fructose-bisphosphate aldolase|uniref:Aldolase n=1 Tax=Serratia liquefaciens TaxID=614 RepID=A0A515CWQ8_SERLI|nr:MULTISPECIES: aldolase [Serratia]AGQ30660.1 aldolase [Serratia liquefaciens ATCC 27592]AYO37564.1 aldolase [Serratia sp. P2ACOL2]QDL32598.1 aldolase [Serratia liquefaciens]RYM72006.1 aldolase [Serratia liquefaciens]RYM73153.1 aldolase [Serratia liquefaciens]